MIGEGMRYDRCGGDMTRYDRLGGDMIDAEGYLVEREVKPLRVKPRHALLR